MQGLANKYIELLLVRQIPIGRQSRDLLFLFLVCLVTQLPEPLVHLALRHIQICSQPNSQFSRRHLFFVVLKNLAENVHLYRFLAVSTKYFFCRIVVNCCAESLERNFCSFFNLFRLNTRLSLFLF